MPTSHQCCCSTRAQHHPLLQEQHEGLPCPPASEARGACQLNADHPCLPHLRPSSSDRAVRAVGLSLTLQAACTNRWSGSLSRLSSCRALDRNQDASHTGQARDADKLGQASSPALALQPKEQLFPGALEQELGFCSMPPLAKGFQYSPLFTLGGTASLSVPPPRVHACSELKCAPLLPNACGSSSLGLVQGSESVLRARPKMQDVCVSELPWRSGSKVMPFATSSLVRVPS